MTEADAIKRITHARSVAHSHVGVHEQGGNNRGPLIDKWHAALGINPGAPWCMSFVQMCFAVAGEPHLLPRTAHCGRFLEMVREFHPQWLTSYGDAVIVIHLDDPATPRLSPGHVGIVIGGEGQQLRTIEGNTNAAGSREGDQVAIKLRPFSYWTACINPARVLGAIPVVELADADTVPINLRRIES